MKDNEHQPITSGIKNCRDTTLFKGCCSHQVPCSLIGTRSVIPNFAYKLPLWATVDKRHED
jgi:hypothetical protein